MNLIFISKNLSALSLVFFFGSFGALLYGETPYLFPPFLICVVSFILCRFFDLKFGEKSRYFPLAIAFLSLDRKSVV